MKHHHLIGHKVRIVQLPETLSYLKDTQGELLDLAKAGYLTGPGLSKPYAVLALGSDTGSGRGLHLNISLDNEGEFLLELI